MHKASRRVWWSTGRGCLGEVTNINGVITIKLDKQFLFWGYGAYLEDFPGFPPSPRTLLYSCKITHLFSFWIIPRNANQIKCSFSWCHLEEVAFFLACNLFLSVYCIFSLFVVFLLSLFFFPLPIYLFIFIFINLISYEGKKSLEIDHLFPSLTQEVYYLLHE